MSIKLYRWVFIFIFLSGINLRAQGEGGSTDIGGAGGECKQGFSRTLVETLNLIEQHSIKLPQGITTFQIQNQFLKLKVKEKERPINCRGEENVPACSRRAKNVIQVRCSKDEYSWVNLIKDDQRQNVLHEVFYWFKQINDQNGFLSAQIIHEINNALHESNFQRVGPFRVCENTSFILQKELEKYFELEQKLNLQKEKRKNADRRTQELMDELNYKVSTLNVDVPTFNRINRLIEREAQKQIDAYDQVLKIESKIKIIAPQVENMIKVDCTKKQSQSSSSKICEFQYSDDYLSVVSSAPSLYKYDKIIARGARLEIINILRSSKENAEPKKIGRVRVLSNTLTHYYPETVAVPGEIVYLNQGFLKTHCLYE